MPRSGKRHGAGRVRGLTGRRNLAKAARLAADGLTPLDILLRSARELYAAGLFAEAAPAAVARAAPYIHQRFAPTDLPARLHEGEAV